MKVFTERCRIKMKVSSEDEGCSPDGKCREGAFGKANDIMEA